MALITTAEAQTLWDDRMDSCKCYNSDTKEAASFMGFKFSSRLEGEMYYINSVQDGVTVTHSSSVTTVETNIKAYLETLEKIAMPIETSTDI